MKIIFGERIGREAILTPGCSAAIFDASGEKLLLTQRTDNGRWCLPGGRMDPGESAAETCVREVLEETGLQVRIVRLVGVYSSPDFILAYADGNRRQLVTLHFLCETTGGELKLSDETTAYGYFSRQEIASLDLMDHHRERIEDTYAGREGAFVR